MTNARALLTLAQHRRRSREVISTLARYGLAENASRDFVTSIERLLRGRLRMSDPALSDLSVGELLRGAMTELGTAWIKLGQLLSLHPDLVGRSVAAELSRLDSAVAADAPELATQTIEQELGAPVSELFARFTPQARASASVAQVHHATLHDGTEAVVKVVRRGVDVRAREDLEIMAALAELWQENDPAAGRYRPVQITREVSTMLSDALDMQVERENLLAFRDRLAHHGDLHIPEPFSRLSSARVLTMTRIQGPPPRGAAVIEEAGWDVEELTHTVVSLYFEMIFDHGTFHADPQSANFALLDGGRLGIMDFGDIGRLTASRREQLERMVLALAFRDAEWFSEVLIEVTDPPSSTETGQLRDDLDRWFTRHIDVGVGHLDVSALIGTGMDLLHRHRLVLPADFTLLIRVLVQLQGLSSAVGVTLDLGELVAPYVRRVLRSRADPRRILRELTTTGLRWRRLADTLPEDLSDMIRGLRRGTVTVNFNVHDPDHLTDTVVDGLIGAAALVSSAQLISRDTPPKVAGVSVPGAVVVGVGAAVWARMAARRRAGFSVSSAVQNVARLRPSTARRRELRDETDQPPMS